ncbi:CocE/NonD family hydrolase [Vulcanococcus limneticus]|uniref:CocE/NonD family hydrolase n=1 Tax=Vulcanococcus limneticus TaxID=2170428 RepID=UPI00398BE7F7
MAAIAGAPGADQPVQVSDASLTTPDGVILVARLWRPVGRGPWPALVMRQPYGRAIASTVTYAHPHWYASQGYAVLVQDVRGRGDSGGVFGGFAQEAVDGSWTLAWLRDQPWCNGRVGCYGFSYQGLSQLLWRDGAQLPDALAPAMAGLDERLHWASDGGAHWWGLGLAWALQLAAEGCRRQGDDAGWLAIRQALGDASFLEAGPELLARHDPGGMGLAWLRRDPLDAQGWRCHQPPAELWSRPMLQIGGWHDPYLHGVLDLWQRAEAGGSDQLLRIGPWTHLNWQGGIDRLQLAFFDRHLRDREPAPAAGQPPALMADLTTGRWLARSPRLASGQHWRLASGGLAGIDAGEGQLLEAPSSGSGRAAGPGAGTVLLVHDPWRPLPGRGGHLGLDAGLVERGDLDQRSDVVCFTGVPLAAPLELLGRPVLELVVAADQPGFDLTVALSVLKPSGAVLQLSTGVARWLGPDAQRPLRRRVALQPLLATLQAGERLRLSIGAAAWPQIAVNPGTGALPAGPSGPRHRVITLELQLAEAELGITPMLGAN